MTHVVLLSRSKLPQPHRKSFFATKITLYMQKGSSRGGLLAYVNAYCEYFFSAEKGLGGLLKCPKGATGTSSPACRFVNLCIRANWRDAGAGCAERRVPVVWSIGGGGFLCCGAAGGRRKTKSPDVLFRREECREIFLKFVQKHFFSVQNQPKGNASSGRTSYAFSCLGPRAFHVALGKIYIPRPIGIPTDKSGGNVTLCFVFPADVSAAFRFLLEFLLQALPRG